MVGKLIFHTSPKSAVALLFLALANRPGVCYYYKGISNHLSGRLRLRRSRQASEAFLSSVIMRSGQLSSRSFVVLILCVLYSVARAVQTPSLPRPGLPPILS